MRCVPGRAASSLLSLPLRLSGYLKNAAAGACAPTGYSPSVTASMLDQGELASSGFTTVAFKEIRWLRAMQDVARSLFPCEPVLWHELEATRQEEHLQVAHAFNAALSEQQLVNK